MAQQYVSSVPSDGSLKPGIASFFESFYAVSDTAAAHEQYADHFTSDAKLIMASKETSGRDGIIEMRHGMWEKVASRSHKPSMVYTFGKGGDDVMLHGTVDYELKDGKKAEGIEWAARARFGSEHGNLKMVFYQVYLDTAAMAEVPIVPVSYYHQASNGMNITMPPRDGVLGNYIADKAATHEGTTIRRHVDPIPRNH
ncbi:hypothetical protein Q7P36_005238 [Cladosporium allicinum]